MLQVEELRNSSFYTSERQSGEGRKRLRGCFPHPGNRRRSVVQDGTGLAVDQTQLDEPAHGLREALWDRTRAGLSHSSQETTRRNQFAGALKYGWLDLLLLLERFWNLCPACEAPVRQRLQLNHNRSILNIFSTNVLAAQPWFAAFFFFLSRLSSGCQRNTVFIARHTLTHVSSSESSAHTLEQKVGSEQTVFFLIWHNREHDLDSANSYS